MRLVARALFVASTVAVVGALAVPAIPVALGYRVMVVMSGSMEPEVRAGDAVLVRPGEVEAIAVGDLVTFRPFGVTGLKTHRVVEIERLDGHLYFQTKGDANATPDADLADSDAVLGIVSVRLPRAGALFVALSSPRVRLLLVGVPGLLVAGQELLRLRAARAAGKQARSAAAPRAAVKRWGVTAGTSRASTFVLVLGLAATLLASRVHPTDALFADTAGIGDNGFATATQFEP